ncbi:MAG: branched-chain amino acid ABC transporter permease [Deltaproteobacteria bacterium]|nr:branched-chain amino acid ABC transporter permease [Deltaproteobacteria bacterium]MBT4638205.1 branched-chain amino acid ABC transporter permease [Deltaproteobacteria bacterium]MBT6501383.1 branched-chain amino acid ABC transporter permease [Deltaproteobacteria bacterium]MBT6614300.1 branched-chain amino acid ABC transporter permease [Deltaproteobacteria bacterium]MBT7155067.1 branched-chain amino acid ABC transporter permease [Deltaproteobacteria bacterium]
MTFFFEVLIAGLLTGVMYSLVALGLVLIFKASGILNMSQGAMALFAALTFVSLLEMGLNYWLALVIILVMMVAHAFIVERVVLRPLVNQPLITLFMVTIGWAYFLEGFAQFLWGTVAHNLELGIPDDAFFVMDVMISQFDIVAAVVAAVLVTVLAVFFNKTRVGLALRAVADDHQGAMSVGIPLRHVWVAVWIVAGIVAIVAGLMWGARIGISFALITLILKAFPVIILGGFTSITGAVVGGLIIGASEKVAEVYLGPFVGGGIENFFPYLLALIFLLILPNGLFGDVHIDRV